VPGEIDGGPDGCELAVLQASDVSDDGVSAGDAGAHMQEFEAAFEPLLIELIDGGLHLEDGLNGAGGVILVAGREDFAEEKEEAVELERAKEAAMAADDGGHDSVVFVENGCAGGVAKLAEEFDKIVQVGEDGGDVERTRLEGLAVYRRIDCVLRDAAGL